MSELGQLFDQLNAFDRPPVETWHPEKTIDFDLRIAANGDWYHEGELIKRHKLVKLFSTVLALRANEYYLVTPPVKYQITVEDHPFMAVEMTIKESENKNQQIYFRTNMDEVVMVDSNHLVAIIQINQEPSPSIHIRDGLKAKLTRSVYYDLVNNHLVESNQQFGIYSNKQFYPIFESPLEISPQIDDH